MPSGVAIVPSRAMNPNMRVAATAARRSWSAPAKSTTIASPPNSSTSPPTRNTSSINPRKIVMSTSLMCSAPDRPRCARRSVRRVNPDTSKNARVPVISLHPPSGDRPGRRGRGPRRTGAASDESPPGRFVDRRRSWSRSRGDTPVALTPTPPDHIVTRSRSGVKRRQGLHRSGSDTLAAGGHG